MKKEEEEKPPPRDFSGYEHGQHNTIDPHSSYVERLDAKDEEKKISVVVRPDDIDHGVKRNLKRRRQDHLPLDGDVDPNDNSSYSCSDDVDMVDSEPLTFQEPMVDLSRNPIAHFPSQQPDVLPPADPSLSPLRDVLVSVEPGVIQAERTLSSTNSRPKKKRRTVIDVVLVPTLARVLKMEARMKELENVSAFNCQRLGTDTVTHLFSLR